MGITLYFRNTAGHVGSLSSTANLDLETTTGTTATQVFSAGNNPLTYAYYSATTFPNRTDWNTGNYTWYLDVTSANSNVELTTVRVSRYSSDFATERAFGTASPTLTLSTTGEKSGTVTFSSPNPAGRASSDRLVVQYTFTRVGAHGTESINADVNGSADTRIDTPLFFEVSATRTHKYNVAGSPPDVDCEVKRFTKETSGTNGATQDVTFSFTPKAMLLFSEGSTADNSFADHYSFCTGFSDGTTSVCVAGRSEDNVTTSDSDRAARNDAIYVKLSETTGSDIVRGSVAFSTNKATFTWSLNNTEAINLCVIAYGGDDIANVKAVARTVGTTSTGVQSYTDLSFTPSDTDSIIFLAGTAASSGSFPEGGIHSQTGFGVAISPTKRWSIYNVSEDGQNPSDTWSYFSTQECITVGSASAGSVTWAADFDSWITNGFQLDITDAASSANHSFIYLVIKGGKWDVGTDTVKTSTGTKTTNVSASTFDILGLGLASIGSTTNNSANTEAKFSVGASDGTNEFWVSTHDTDNSSATVAVRRNSATSRVAGTITANATASSSSLDFDADFSSFGTDQFTLNYQAAGASAYTLGWWILAGATGTTTVTSTRTHKYNIIGKLTTTRTHKYNLQQTLTSTRTHKYNLLNAVSATRTHKYNLLELVSALRTHKYNLESKITATRTHKFNLLELVTATRTHKYNLLEAVSTTRTHKYNIIALVQALRTHKYNIIGLVTALRTHKYNIEQLVTATRTHKYNIIQTLTATRTHLYNIIALLTSTRTHKYNIIQQLIETRTHKYNVQAGTTPITETRTHKFNILQLVTANRTHKYNIEQLVTALRTHKYNIIGLVTATRTHKYNIIELVSATRTHKYNIIGLVQALRTHKYDMEGLVSALRTHKFNILEAVTKTTTHKYNILALVQALRTHKYDIIALVTALRTHKYHVEGLVTATRTHLYNILNTVTAVKTHKFNLLEAVTKTTTHKYNITALLTTLRTHKYNLVQTLTTTRTHLYNLLQSLTTQRTHKYNIVAAVTATRTHLYHIIQQITALRTHKYDVESALTTVTANRTHKFNIIAKLTTTRTHLYNILNTITTTRTHKFTLLNSVSTIKTHKYDILQLVTATRTHKYGLGGAVTTTRTHKYDVASIALPEGSGGSTNVYYYFPRKPKEILDIIPATLPNTVTADILVFEPYYRIFVDADVALISTRTDKQIARTASRLGYQVTDALGLQSNLLTASVQAGSGYQQENKALAAVELSSYATLKTASNYANTTANIQLTWPFYHSVRSLIESRKDPVLALANVQIKDTTPTKQSISLIAHKIMQTAEAERYQLLIKILQSEVFD